MVDAPERIWASKTGTWLSHESPSQLEPAEYVRADLYEQAVRERDSAQKLADSNYANICTQHRQIEDLTANALTAERLAGARVKALEWHDKSIAIMPYYAECDDDGRWRYAISAPKDCSSFTLKRYGVDCGEYPTLDEAKAAAQADFERRILSALAEPAGKAEPWGWVIPKRGKRKPVIFEADKFDEVSAAAEAEIGDLGYFPVYTTPPDASAIRGAQVEAVVQAVRPYTRETLLIDEHRDLVRAALAGAKP